jgi:glutathione S-transferase
MLKLHYFPGNASLIVHIVLEEIGVPFALAYVDRARAEHKSPGYLALNPNGLIPVLVDDASRGADGGPLVLYETAAICLHLADVHSAAGLLPAFGTRERAIAYKWVAWLATTVQPVLTLYFYPERWARDAAGAVVVQGKAEATVGGLLDQLDAEFARHGGEWLLGASFSIADAYAFVLCRWTRGFARPARARPQLQFWLERMLARPAVQRAFATEQLAPPFV